jgi:hypothetical protein
MITPTRNYAIGFLAIALMPAVSARAIDVPVQTAVQTKPRVAAVTPAALTMADNETVAVTPVQWGYRGYGVYRPYYGGYRPYYGSRAYYGRPYSGGWGYARPYYSYRPYGYGYRPYGYGYRGFGYYPRYSSYGPVWY